nr:hypothetical protein [uncultured bacterium]
MNIPIAQALMLTCAGNAFLRGVNLEGFWPHALVFRFSKSCAFRLVEGERDMLIAPDPLAWFETLRSQQIGGLRLHHAPRPRGPAQTLAVEDRKLVGFVGGGPAWLIEVVGDGPSAIWQGFEQIGERNDPEQKIWINTYLRVGETTAQDFAALPLAQASADLKESLVEIEALARRMKFAPFDAMFAAARASLEGGPIDHAFAADADRYAAFDVAQQRLLGAVLHAWVFGAMGSWNDIAPDEADKDDYERLSEQLFVALNDAICALANSTCAP